MQYDEPNELSGALEARLTQLLATVDLAQIVGTAALAYGMRGDGCAVWSALPDQQKCNMCLPRTKFHNYILSLCGSKEHSGRNVVLAAPRRAAQAHPYRMRLRVLR